MPNFWLDERHDVLAALKAQFSSFVGRDILEADAWPVINKEMGEFWKNHPDWKKKYYGNSLTYVCPLGTKNGKYVFSFYLSCGIGFYSTLEL